MLAIVWKGYISFGLVAFPYFAFFELLGPVIEIVGPIATIYWWAEGRLSTLFLVYTGTSIAQTFFATAAAYAGLSLWAIRPSATSAVSGRSSSWAWSACWWRC